jgi:hypothetical protein
MWFVGTQTTDKRGSTSKIMFLITPTEGRIKTKANKKANHH